jgi:hypothetical protein
MSTGIEIKVWLKDTEEALEKTFAQMVQAIASWTQTSGPWRNFCIHDSHRYSRPPLFKVQEDMSIHHLNTLIEQKRWQKQRKFGALDTSSLRFSADTFFRYEPGDEDRRMGMSMYCWNRGSLRGGADRRWEGDACIYIWRLRPFVEDIDHSGERIDRLLDFLATLIEQIQPVALKVFNEDREYFLFNAHLAYYYDEASIANDLEFLFQLWEHGLDAYSLPPLKSFSTMPLREPDREEKEEVTERWKQFQRLLKEKPIFSKDRIHQVLQAKELDIYRLPVGDLILSTYPDCFRACLDHFYALLLEKHAEEGK